jgi:dihydroorotase
MNPPLRSQSDVEACIAGVADGTIDILATDHAPHLAEEKELEFPDAPFGIIGLECALALYIKAVVEPAHIDWMKLIDVMSTTPAKIVRLDEPGARGRGTLREGAVADVTVIDPNAEWTIDSEQFASKSRNCPFNGWKVKGQATHTIVSGVEKWRAAR